VEMTTSQAVSAGTRAAELTLIREAVNLLQHVGPRRAAVQLYDLAARWRTIVPSEHGKRLVDTYVQMYSSLEDDGVIDLWGGSECKTVLSSLVAILPNAEERRVAVREALEAMQGQTSGHVGAVHLLAG
jgi:hypothetical protein